MDPVPKSPAEEREIHLAEIEGLRARVAALDGLLADEISAKASLFRTVSEHQGRYLDLVESAPWIVARVDPGGRYVDANSHFAETLGRAVGEVLDRPVGSLGEGPGWEAAVMAFAQTDAPRSEPASVGLDLHGGRRSFLLLMHRPHPERAFTVLALDQTERDEALARAEASSRDKSMFLAVMSHELRTPMNGVLGLASLLRDTGLSDHQRGLVDTIEGTGTTLVRIINDVLDLSRAESGAVEFESVPFSVRQVVRTVTSTLAASCRSSSVTLTAELDENIPAWSTGDPHRLQQVLTNLVGNGLKFAPNGAVHVSVRAESSGQDRSSMTFSVEDDGIGIPPSEMDRLFEAFAQADSSVSRQYGGTGLGLTIARQIVRDMGGDISATSEPGRGTRFEFTVCLEHAAPPEIGPEAALPQGVDAVAHDGDAPLRVLVAEDNRVNQRVAVGMLEYLGHTVTLAANGAEALDALQEASFDLVLMDVNMPVLDGLEATRRIRSGSARCNKTPIVALTANAIEGDREVCLAAGMDGYLAKPFTKEELASVVSLFGSRVGSN